ncbi:MAG: holo-ACP synthase [Actinomycetota bacterium]|nr:holo-ACP synthase [Actinomycetota bacterium]
MLRMGVDVVDIARLERLMLRWPRLQSRLFTKQEIDYALSRAHPPENLAARLAAKEATFKALGTGWPGISWHDVEVVTKGHREPPQLKLTGRAAQLGGGCQAIVSLAHDGGIALAHVLLLPATGPADA